MRICCAFFLLFSASLGIQNLNRVKFVIISQPQNVDVARETKRSLELALGGDAGGDNVLLAHENEAFHGAWTYFPVLERMAQTDFDWLVFLEESSAVNLDSLAQVLDVGDPKTELLHLGHALVDRDSVVIHHYDAPGLRYAHPGAGIILSAQLVKMLAQSEQLEAFPKDFSIDAQYELAKVIKVNFGVALLHDERLCASSKTSTSECAIRPVLQCSSASDGEVLALAQRTLFAVKTCAKFHQERLPVISDTWEPAAPNVMFFSEEADARADTHRHDLNVT